MGTRGCPTVSEYFRIHRRMVIQPTKLKVLALLAGAAVPLVGCNIATTTKRTLINEPLLVADDTYLQKKFHHLAKQAWREFQAGCPGSPAASSHAFKDGFIDGFVDQLDSGGTADPPTQPPRKYWLAKHLNPIGALNTMDYFNGFRQGAEIAQASGLRRQFEVPMFVPDSKSFSDHHPKYAKPSNSGSDNPLDPNTPLLPPPKPDPASRVAPGLPPAQLPGANQ